VVAWWGVWLLIDIFSLLVAYLLLLAFSCFNFVAD
jgi:hypothetical protein